MPLAPGHRLGPYEIVALLGEGGMGTLYQARDPRLGRDVAIKIIREGRAGGHDAGTRFEREVRAVAALSHPNVVVIHDVGTADGIAFAVTELLQGQTLRERLLRSLPTWPEAVGLALGIADGMAAAHARGIVHRDLKPSNVFLTEDGRVKVLDFGLAVICETSDALDPEAETPSRLTRPGAVLGTPDYMSPEQARGAPVDARSDVFSFACVLQEMITGRPPFARPSVAETLAAILNEDPLPLPPALPPALLLVIRRCLQKDPTRRFATGQEVATRLGALAEQPFVEVGTSDPMDSLAVLPFADLSPERDQAYFCDGLAEELISALTRISGLRVASRTSSFQFRGTAADVREIGRRLGVRVVLEGSVRKAGDRLRITVQVTEAAQGFSLSSECYDRSFEDVLEVQEDIARRVVEALAIKLSENERRTLEQPPTGDARAYDFYLRGRGLLHQYRVSSMLEAREMFRSAVAADSSFALAHAGLSDVCSWLYPWRGRDPECLVEALAASERALELRPDLAEAHVSRGQALAISGELDSADRAFRTAIRLNPRLFEAHHAYGRSCLERGRSKDAIELFERASALRPEDYHSPSMVAMAYSGRGLHEQARGWDERTLAAARQHFERYPQDVRVLHYIGLAYIRLGDVERGLEWVERARQMDPQDAAMLYNVACAYALAGRTDQALDVLEEALDHAMEIRAWISNDSDFSQLRDHPRFQALLSRMC